MNPLQHYIPNSQQPGRAMDTVKAKQVRFSERSQMLIVDVLHQGTHQCNMWYSGDELVLLKAWNMRSIMRTRVQLSRRVASRSDVHERAEILGLEKHLSSELTQEFKRRKREMFLAVKMEQQHQKFLRSPNPDRLATVSRQHSRWAMKRAHLAAQLLQRDLSSPTDDYNTHSR
mmetsp:Transcript_4083/g.7275  ORF Transcript_4083/g.7275 Transcript_4083/m.7275 type:complete len:173 (+) Transcript_4083:152-670(+)